MRAEKQKPEQARWARRYRAALRRYVNPTSDSDLGPAIRLGRQAVALRMETLDIVRIHERMRTVSSLSDDATAGAQGARHRARLFLTEVLVPIEQTHAPVRKTNARANQLAQSLRRRTRESAVATRQLKQGVVRRQAAEEAFRKGETHRADLKVEAHRLQKHLSRLTHGVLTAQEKRLKKSGDGLRNEVAQSLLAIHIHLLGLKKSARTTTGHLKKEIVETQRVVRQSVRTVQRLARTFEDDHET